MNYRFWLGLLIVGLGSGGCGLMVGGEYDAGLISFGLSFLISIVWNGIDLYRG